MSNWFIRGRQSSGIAAAAVAARANKSVCKCSLREESWWLSDTIQVSHVASGKKLSYQINPVVHLLDFLWHFYFHCLDLLVINSWHLEGIHPAAWRAVFYWQSLSNCTSLLGGLCPINHQFYILWIYAAYCYFSGLHCWKKKRGNRSNPFSFTLLHFIWFTKIVHLNANFVIKIKIKSIFKRSWLWSVIFPPQVRIFNFFSTTITGGGRRLHSLVTSSRPGNWSPWWPGIDSAMPWFTSIK